ncbi:MAG: hypothetical protein ABI868_19385 [Acidobacteriota bacterium]
MLLPSLMVTGDRSLSKLPDLARKPGRPPGGTALVVAMTIGWLGGTIAAGQRVNPQAFALQEFTDRIAGYLALQKRLASTLNPAPADNPAQVDVFQKALADAIRAARRQARPGDIFGDAGRHIRELIRQDARERSVRDAYAAMEEVPRHTTLKVNVTYPPAAALATVPPLILNRLPTLPDGIEFRFMGRELILRDTRANLIVDFIHEAVPTIRR